MPASQSSQAPQTSQTLQNLKTLCKKPPSKSALKSLLDSNYLAHNHESAVSESNPDPLLMVYRYREHKNIAHIALICALFSYGNVRAILKFLGALDFDLLDSSEAILRYDFPYYRFQNAFDVKLLFLTLCEIKLRGGLESIMFGELDSSGQNASANARANSNTKQNHRATLESVRSAINHIKRVASGILRGEVMGDMRAHFPASYITEHAKSGDFTRGFSFLVGDGAVDSSAPLKRWNMFLRWMVRKDNVDLGLWQGHMKPSCLLLPLDTHTLRVSRALGLLKRKSYDIKAVIEVSEALAKFCPQDPIKYDFALYRIGQSGGL
ncbi:TIGR02757 family protein [Helicobacter sp. CLO-3]|uniref:TIGR02757 family protein n=1 Tax=unclassified Helicobacter TaxID=2593540 RepID=UPI0008060709|nr:MULTISPECIES: TIGR02757 family protein [unclassified Helicobacter]OBV28476.1 TIGR02757 family protein [Helicobacter sp. CLO-3]OHU81795.1 TIGR02757 family protein [Helicobacter sp. CLO-3]